MNNNKQVIIKKENSLLNDYFKVDEVYLQFQKFDGSMSKEIRRLNFKREDVSCVLLFDKLKKTILLIKQFRYPVFTKENGYVLEVPAGILEQGENPHDAMIRETIEETGYAVTNPNLIFTFFTSPGISSERCHLFYAEVEQNDKSFLGGGLSSENEDIQSIWIQYNEILPMLISGIVRDAKTLIALQWFLLSGFCK
jgi:nudix-type nucleoside diphosphatase (YffH/AdpP family)